MLYNRGLIQWFSNLNMPQNQLRDTSEKIEILVPIPYVFSQNFLKSQKNYIYKIASRLDN